jgi:magnesium-transporting ATPase (P-type)
LTKNEMTAVAVRTAATLYRITGVGYAPEGDIMTEGGSKVEGVALEKLQRLLHGMLLCNDSALSRAPNNLGKEDWMPNGAPTEVALITLGCKAGLDPKELKNAKPRVLSVPFESEHKFMATVHQEAPGPAGRVMYVKGAPDRLLPLCVDQIQGDDVGVAKGALDKGFWDQAQADLSSQGLRVLALCR